MSKGLVFIPCELIDDNGGKLRRIVPRVTREWELGKVFVSWIKNTCIFGPYRHRLFQGGNGHSMDRLSDELWRLTLDTSKGLSAYCVTD